jgi:polyisoprenoid-binding protein YceI
MKRLIFPAAFAALLTALPAAAEPEAFTLDPDHTFPFYEIGHVGYSFQRGRFDKTSGKIVIDRVAKTGSADITIEVASVDSGVPKLDQHLKSEEFFNAARFPQMTFKADRFEFDGDKLRSASGELTIAGVSRPVTLTASYFNCAPHPMNKKMTCGADFSTRIKRSDYGIEYGLPLLADDVLLRINVEAIKD